MLSSLHLRIVQRHVWEERTKDRFQSPSLLETEFQTPIHETTTAEHRHGLSVNVQHIPLVVNLHCITNTHLREYIVGLVNLGILRVRPYSTHRIQHRYRFLLYPRTHRHIKK